MKQYEQIWIAVLDAAIEKEIGNPDFKLDDLAKAVATSIAQLHVKVPKLTGLTPKMYLQKKRLEKANELLEKGAYATVREVAFAVGYKHVSYFSTIYEERYRKKPIAYLK
jgi:transcriptional regulator GlxA family with amidase domain